MGLINETNEQYYEGSNLGDYRFVPLQTIIDNFMVAYVGDGKVLDSVRRTDVIFHAKRALQELSYDTLKSYKSQEVEVGPSLSVPIPQDMVNYVKLTWVGDDGIERLIHPTTLTSNPTQVPLQDNNFEYLFDNTGQIIEGTSIIEESWGNGVVNNEGDSEFFDASSELHRYHTGTRYGISPQHAQSNGWFTINERDGTFSFSSDMLERVIIIKYITDGLGFDEDTRVPKLAEEAMYMYIIHAILSTKIGAQEYLIERFNKRRRAAIRNAKIRLSNIKLEEISQVFRGKSKIIKH